LFVELILDIFVSYAKFYDIFIPIPNFKLKIMHGAKVISTQGAKGGRSTSPHALIHQTFERLK